MIETRFADLPPVIFHLSEESVGGYWFVPDIHVAHAADAIVRILNEIERAQHADAQANRSLLPPHVPASGDDFLGFRAREVWRIGSYVVFGLNLAGILQELHAMALRSLEEVVPEESATQRTRHAERVIELRAAVAEVRLVRNKVFAHTAFADPRTEDTASLQATSLLYLESMGVVLEKDGFRIGAGVRVVDGDRSGKLPEFSMRTLSSLFRAHLAEWFALLADVCERVRSLPDHVFLEKYEQVVRIERPVREAPELKIA